MAVESKLILRGEDRTKAAFRQAKKNTDQLKNSIKGLVGAYAAFKVVGAVISAHRKFGAAISDLAAITGAAGKDLEFFRQKSKEIGETTTLSASQAAEAFKLVASAKPDLLDNAAALAEVTTQVVLLSEAAGSELTESAKTVGSALNQFSADADEAARFVNVLAAGAKFGASEIADTSEALKVAGLVASAAGTSFEETNAAIQAMSTVALKGAEAGTGLRNVYLNLAKQSNDKFKPELVGLTQALMNIKDAGLTTNEMLDIFGKKNIVAASALVNTVDKLGGLTEKLTGTQTAIEQARIKVDNFDGDIKKMGSAWEAAAISLGETFDPALRFTVQTMGGAAKVIQTINLAVSDFGDSLGAFAARAQAILSGNIGDLKTINALRNAQIEINEKELEGIWNKTIATSEAQTEEEKLAAAQKSRAESAIRLAEQEAELRRKQSEENALQIENSNFLFEDSMNKRLNAFNRTLQTEKEKEDERFLQAQLRLEEELVFRDLSEEAHNEKSLEIARTHEENLTKIAKKGAKNRVQTNINASHQIANVALQLASILASGSEAGSKKEFENQKKLSMASTVINTSQAVMKAYSSAANPYIGAVLAALVGAVGAAQLAKISGTKYGGGGSTAPTGSMSAGSGGGGSGSSSPPPATQSAPPATQTQASPELKINFLLDGGILGSWIGKASRNGTLDISAEAIT